MLTFTENKKMNRRKTWESIDVSKDHYCYDTKQFNDSWCKGTKATLFLTKPVYILQY